MQSSLGNETTKSGTSFKPLSGLVLQRRFSTFGPLSVAAREWLRTLPESDVNTILSRLQIEHLSGFDCSLGIPVQPLQMLLAATDACDPLLLTAVTSAETPFTIPQLQGDTFVYPLPSRASVFCSAEALPDFALDQLAWVRGAYTRSTEYTKAGAGAGAGEDVKVLVDISDVKKHVGHDVCVVGYLDEHESGSFSLSDGSGSVDVVLAAACANGAYDVGFNGLQSILMIHGHVEHGSQRFYIVADRIESPILEDRNAQTRILGQASFYTELFNAVNGQSFTYNSPVPDYSGVWRLASCIGAERARELLAGRELDKVSPSLVAAAAAAVRPTGTFTSTMVAEVAAAEAAAEVVDVNVLHALRLDTQEGMEMFNLYAERTHAHSIWPAMLVLCGEFTTPESVGPGRRFSSDWVAWSWAMETIGQVLTRVGMPASVRVVIIPSLREAGGCLPQRLPQLYLSPLSALLPTAMLAPSPARLRVYTHEFVVFNYPVEETLRRSCVLPPLHEDDFGTELDAAAHIHHTLSSQQHLLPVPVDVAPAAWSAGPTLALRPLPEAVVIADENAGVVMDGMTLVVTGSGSQFALLEWSRGNINAQINALKV